MHFDGGAVGGAVPDDIWKRRLKTLKKAGFRARFDAAVVAVRREGCALSGKLGDIILQSGDFLILYIYTVKWL